ncbi:hypothetical protein KCP71_09990 [Salmonella enterica subsp. enterica]|nr:hypothetical protein KCP71_09990 [Salmonella enterica subsp. enterica]
MSGYQLNGYWRSHIIWCDHPADMAAAATICGTPQNIGANKWALRKTRRKRRPYWCVNAVPEGDVRKGACGAVWRAPRMMDCRRRAFISGAK